jgi:cytochrome c-type biogenesis protein CcmH/NrfF
MILLAHAGHWLVWVLYAIPVIAVLLAVLFGSLRTRRQVDRRDGG